MESVWILMYGECMDCANQCVLMVCDSEERAYEERKLIIKEHPDFALQNYIDIYQYPVNKEKQWC